MGAELLCSSAPHLADSPFCGMLSTRMLVQEVLDELALTPGAGVPAAKLFERLAARGVPAADPTTAALVLRLALATHGDDIIAVERGTVGVHVGPLAPTHELLGATLAASDAARQGALGLTPAVARLLKEAHVAALVEVARRCAG